MNSDILQKVVAELSGEATRNPKLVQDKMSQLAAASMNFGPALITDLISGAHEKLTKEDAASQVLLLEIVSSQSWFSILLSHICLSFMLVGMKYQEAIQFEDMVEK